MSSGCSGSITDGSGGNGNAIFGLPAAVVDGTGPNDSDLRAL